MKNLKTKLKKYPAVLPAAALVFVFITLTMMMSMAATSYTITVVDGKASQYTGSEGDVIEIWAAQIEGKTFDKWVSNDRIVFKDAYSADTSFIMPANSVTVTAVFKPVYEKPETAEPVYGEPETAEPVYEEPETAEPLYEEPKKEPGQIAIESIKNQAGYLSAAQKEDIKTIDLLILFSEEAIAEAASAEFSGGSININKTNVSALQTAAGKIKSSAERTLIESGVEIVREIDAGIKFKTNETKKIMITVEPSAANMTADNIRIETPNYAVTIPKAAVAEGTKSGNLVITVDEIDPAAVLRAFITPDPYAAIRAYAANTGKEMQYKVNISPQTKENIKYSFEPSSGDVNYQAVFMSSTGTPVGGKYNPVTKKIDTRIRFSDTYTVKENKKDFKDITSKSKAMQDAIKVLASKGIINGKSASVFDPDGAITRAEIAALVIRTLSKLDESADGRFADVKKSDWFCGAVGSAKSYNIINGMSATTFEPQTKIKKEQIIAIAARTLRTEMKWKTPADKEKHLKKFTDRSALQSWGIDDFALASMADLIVLRTDGKFNPTDTMTRGNAAVVLYRLFEKIW